MKRIKLIHEDLNAGGGAERLAAASLEVLSELDLSVDLVTFTKPNWNQLERIFGITKLRKYVNNVIRADISSLLDEKNKASVNNDYDIVMNAHGDILPSNMFGVRKENLITYCHYPLVPELIRSFKYDTVLRNYLKMCDYKFESLDKLRTKALQVYNQMMNNSTVVTNSIFSSKAVKLYYPRTDPLIIYPPIDIDYFSRAVSSEGRENRIVVLGRFNPDKNIELALEVAKVLKGMNTKFEMSIVGNLSRIYYPYFNYLQKLIKVNGLSNMVDLKTNVDINDLLTLFGKSKVLFHPTIGEPFGMCIAEAMSAGLVPVVPSFGGNTEFVPRSLRYSNQRQAAKIILKSMNASLRQRFSLSNSVKKFGKERFKDNLKRLLSEKVVAP
ncbi:MAG TPA: glycosyltransferase family 4 protein [Nitrososphaeraceae archaeon]|jgi:glycosyltransferase involved in cell wall biosynthesis|nr:glycosyltransferase family 4 protein [Nitrososphaeraceae archaeon]